MNRPERLMATTDLSAPARHAAERAAIVARDTGATLHLLHVVSETAVEKLQRLLGAAGDDVEARLRRKTEDDVAQLREHLAGHYGLQPHSNVITGALLAGILGQADAVDVDLLVLGARGASYMRHLVLGSTAERLTRRSTRSMLVVKQPPHEPYRRVLVAVDLSSSSQVCVDKARAVVPHADLVLLHAYDVPFEDSMRLADVREEALLHYQHVARQRAVEGMHAFCSSVGLDHTGARTVVLKGDPTQRILEQEQELDCDLIVVGKQGETPAEEFLLGSVTKHVLQQSQADVLIVV